MQKKLEEQTKELEQRTITISALQRNFESLSTFCRNEKILNESLSKENQQYISERSEMHAKVSEFEIKMRDSAAECQKLRDENRNKAKTEKELEELKIDFAGLEKKLKNKMRDIENLEGVVRVAKIEAEKQKKEAGISRSQVVQKQVIIDEKEKQIQLLDVCIQIYIYISID